MVCTVCLVEGSEPGVILGLGVDLVALPAFEEQVGSPGSRFVERVLTGRERRAVDARVCADGAAVGGTSRADVAALARHVGARWAAKEAVIKAWSAALYGVEPVIGVEAVDWREIEVVQDRWGRPGIVLHGHIAAEVKRTVGAGSEPGRELVWHVSLSHDGDYATATVFLEAR